MGVGDLAHRPTTTVGQQEQLAIAGQRQVTQGEQIQILDEIWLAVRPEDIVVDADQVEVE